MPPPARRPFRWQALLILWPAFVMAGVLEMLVRFSQGRLVQRLTGLKLTDDRQ